LCRLRRPNPSFVHLHRGCRYTEGINVGLVSWSFLTMALLSPLDIQKTFNPSLGPATEYTVNATTHGAFNDLRATAQRVSTVHGRALRYDTIEGGGRERNLVCVVLCLSSSPPPHRRLLPHLTALSR
jgi:hypothetical protein